MKIVRLPMMLTVGEFPKVTPTILIHQLPATTLTLTTPRIIMITVEDSFVSTVLKDLLIPAEVQTPEI